MRSLLVGCAVVLGVCLSGAHAGTITSITFPTGTVVPFSFGDNNDNVGEGSLNFVSYSTQNIGLDPLDVTFSATSSAGTREYHIVGSVKNVSDRSWAGFQLLLGSGVGSEFGPSTIPDLDLDFPDRDSPRDFSIFAAFPKNDQATLITWFETILPNASPGLSFALDVPDAPDGQPYSFTVRLAPILPVASKTFAQVPEPASMSCLLVLLAFGRWQLRRRV